VIRYPSNDSSAFTIDSSTPTSTPNFKKHPLLLSRKLYNYNEILSEFNGLQIAFRSFSGRKNTNQCCLINILLLTFPFPQGWGSIRMGISPIFTCTYSLIKKKKIRNSYFYIKCAKQRFFELETVRSRQKIHSTAQKTDFGYVI
jgi:hypothetical protein